MKMLEKNVSLRETNDDQITRYRSREKKPEKKRNDENSFRHFR